MEPAVTVECGELGSAQPGLAGKRLQAVGRPGVAVDPQAVPAHQLGQAADVVAMQVGHEHRIEAGGIDLVRTQLAVNPPRSDAAVDQYVGVGRTDVGAVAL